MKLTVRDWAIEKLLKERENIAFPEYQREKQLWNDERKSLLIDSILNDIDIPKLYFNKTPEGSYEVVDGQQRLWAVWDFFEGQYAYSPDEIGPSAKERRLFEALTDIQKKRIRLYKFQIVEFEGADDDYLRKLFIRL
jgi:hypothetical protein